MPQPCLTLQCQCVLPDNHPTGFCSTCESIIKERAKKLDKQMDRYLKLESEFVRWCSRNGHPHPHA